MSGPSLTHWRPTRVDAAGAAVLALLTLLLYVTAVAPLMAGAERRRTAADELAARRQEAAAASAAVRGLQQRLAATQRALAESPLRLEPSRRVNQRHAEVTRLAGEAGLEIRELQPGAAARQAFCEAVPMEISGSGGYPAAAEFLRRLHRVFPDMAVAAFDLAGDPAQPMATPSFRFNLVWHASPSPGPGQ